MTTSEELEQAPELKVKFGDGSTGVVNLSGSGKSWKGNLYIPKGADSKATFEAVYSDEVEIADENCNPVTHSIDIPIKIISGKTFFVDTTPPYVISTTPLDGEVIYPDEVPYTVNISAELIDPLVNGYASGIDTSWGNMTLDGNRISLNVTETSVSFTSPGLKTGDHRVTLIVRDNAGNESGLKSWTFFINIEPPILKAQLFYIDDKGKKKPIPKGTWVEATQIYSWPVIDRTTGIFLYWKDVEMNATKRFISRVYDNGLVLIPLYLWSRNERDWTFRVKLRSFVFSEGPKAKCMVTISPEIPKPYDFISKHRDAQIYKSPSSSPAPALSFELSAKNCQINTIKASSIWDMIKDEVVYVLDDYERGETGEVETGEVDLLPAEALKQASSFEVEGMKFKAIPMSALFSPDDEITVTIYTPKNDTDGDGIGVVKNIFDRLFLV
jgi:hypothetical protein